MLRVRLFAAALLLALSAASVSGRAQSRSLVRAGEFDFDDARLLAPKQKGGGLLHVAGKPTAATPLPLVVFLHGLNFTGQKHLWFGGGRADLRAVADRIAEQSGAFLFAAPSQTKDAGAARTLWSDFELGAFVAAVEHEASRAGLRVDHRKIVLVGHSGAGCNPDGGLFSPVAADDETPRAILAIDTCLDEDVGRSAARTQRLVIVAWQEREWPRDPDGALRGFYEESDPENVERFQLEKIDVTGPDAHNAIVPMALEQTLPQLLALD